MIPRLHEPQWLHANGITGTGDLTKLRRNLLRVSAIGQYRLENQALTQAGTWEVNGRGGLPLLPAIRCTVGPDLLTAEHCNLRPASASPPNIGYRINSGSGTFDTQANSLSDSER